MAANSISISCNLCGDKELLQDFECDHIKALKEARRRGWTITTALGAQCPKCSQKPYTGRDVLKNKLKKLEKKG